MNKKQKNILSLSGIIRWRLRNQAPVVDTFCYLLQDTEGRCSGLLLADQESSIALLEQEQLVEKIATAVTQRYSRVPFADSVFTDTLKCVILLGNSAQRLFLSKTKNTKMPCPLITAASLSELMLNVDAKKKLWQQLKPWVEFFNFP